MDLSCTTATAFILNCTTNKTPTSLVVHDVFRDIAHGNVAKLTAGVLVQKAHKAARVHPALGLARLNDTPRALRVERHPDLARAVEHSVALAHVVYAAHLQVEGAHEPMGVGSACAARQAHAAVDALVGAMFFLRTGAATRPPAVLAERRGVPEAHPQPGTRAAHMHGCNAKVLAVQALSVVQPVIDAQEGVDFVGPRTRKRKAVARAGHAVPRGGCARAVHRKYFQVNTHPI